MKTIEETVENWAWRKRLCYSWNRQRNVPNMLFRQRKPSDSPQHSNTLGSNLPSAANCTGRSSQKNSMKMLYKFHTYTAFVCEIDLTTSFSNITTFFFIIIQYRFLYYYTVEIFNKYYKHILSVCWYYSFEYK